MIKLYISRSEGEGARYRALAQDSRDMVFRMSIPDGRFLYVSPESRDVTGYDPEKFADDPGLIRKIIAPAWRDIFEETRADILAGNVPAVMEYQIVHKSGETRWVNQWNTLVRAKDGSPVAVEGAITDITPDGSALRRR